MGADIHYYLINEYNGTSSNSEGQNVSGGCSTEHVALGRNGSQVSSSTRYHIHDFGWAVPYLAPLGYVRNVKSTSLGSVSYTTISPA